MVTLSRQHILPSSRDWWERLDEEKVPVLGAYLQDDVLSIVEIMSDKEQKDYNILKKEIRFVEYTRNV